MILKKNQLIYFPQKSTFFHSSKEQFPCNMYYWLEVNTLFFIMWDIAFCYHNISAWKQHVFVSNQKIKKKTQKNLTLLCKWHAILDEIQNHFIKSILDYNTVKTLNFLWSKATSPSWHILALIHKTNYLHIHIYESHFAFSIILNR